MFNFFFRQFNIQAPSLVLFISNMFCLRSLRFTSFKNLLLAIMATSSFFTHALFQMQMFHSIMGFFKIISASKWERLSLQRKEGERGWGWRIVYCVIMQSFYKNKRYAVEGEG